MGTDARAAAFKAKAVEREDDRGDQDHDHDYDIDPNRIDGDLWFEAVKPCQCGQAPDVWRTYVEVRGERRYSVRCHKCNHEIQGKSRRRAIRFWNEAVSPPPTTKKGWAK